MLTRPAKIRQNRDPTRSDPRVHPTRGQLWPHLIAGSAGPSLVPGYRLQRPRSSGWGHAHVYNTPSPEISSAFIISGALTLSSQVRNLGVVIDSELSMTAHVNNLVKVRSFHLRQLRLIRRSLDFDAAHALIRAFIHSRLDYCNICAGLSARTITDSPELVCSSSPPAARSGKCINPDAQRSLHRAALAMFPTADHIQTVPADFHKALHDDQAPRSTWCDVAFGFHPTRAELVWGQLPLVNSSCRELPRKFLATGHSQAPDPSHGTVCPV